jgi:hypothetical protein
MPLPDDWPTTHKHFDPGWNHTILDRFDLCVESDASRVLDVLPKVAPSQLGFWDGAKISFQIYNLLEHDHFLLENRLLLWQPRSHRWTQIDSTYYPLGSGLAEELARLLVCSAYQSSYIQSIWGHHWSAWRNGELAYDYEADEFGIDELTPVEKRKVRPPQTVYSPNRWVAFYSTNPLVKTEDPEKDALILREQMEKEFDFYVGCFSLFDDVRDVWEQYSKNNFTAAFAVDVRKADG